MSDYLLLKQGGYLLLKQGGRLLLEEQQPVPVQVTAAGGGAWREWHKAHEKHVKRMWQEIAKREAEDKDELGRAFDRAQGIVAAASEVLSLPAPIIVPEPILELAQAIPAKQTRERDRQSSRLLKLISDLQAIQEAEEDEEDVWLLLAA